MEDIIKKQTYIPHSTPSPLAMHKNSQTISKTKPKIRIIHIFAPEIIKTDVENFRELVQRLTGKPTDQRNQKICRKKLRNPRREEESRITSDVHEMPVLSEKVELRSTFLGLETRDQKVKEEEEEEEQQQQQQILWNGANSGGFAPFHQKVELRSTFLGLETRDQKVKEEEQQQQQILWNGANSGGFLNGFADFEGFIQELGEFPLLPMDSSHPLHGFEGTQYA